MDNYALRFDGSNDNVNCGSRASLDNITNLTIEAWIYPTGWGEDVTYGYGRIVDKKTRKLYLVNGESNNGTVYNRSLKFTQHFSGGDVWWFAPANVLSSGLNNWYHVAVVYNSGSPFNRPVFYINGARYDGILDTNSTQAGSADADASYSLYIGSNMGVDRSYRGTIDEVRVWRTIRTQADIQNNLGKRISPASANLAGYWRMDENTGLTAFDSTSNDNDGNIYQAVWTAGYNLLPE